MRSYRIQILDPLHGDSCVVACPYRRSLDRGFVDKQHYPSGISRRGDDPKTGLLQPIMRHCHYTGIDKLGAARAVTLRNTFPLPAVLIGILFLGEPITALGMPERC